MIDPIIKIMKKSVGNQVEFLNYRSFQNMRPPFQFSKSTSPDVSLLHNAFKEAHGDVTTGVTRLFLSGVDRERAGNETTQSATQVGPRAVKSGLGGHDDRASGVDDGVERAPLPLCKRGRSAMSEYVPFSGFCGKGNDLGREKTKALDRTILSNVKPQRLLSQIVYQCDGTAKCQKNDRITL